MIPIKYECRPASDLLQAVLHATKPFLIDVVSQTFSATPLSESVVQILKTCVKAAAYSLNIIHVLHEQGLLGMSAAVVSDQTDR